MASRMDRYKDENPKTYSRSSKNQELYQNIGNNTRYTSITDVTNANAIDLDNAKSRANTREGYHQIKEFNQKYSEQLRNEFKCSISLSGGGL